MKISLKYYQTILISIALSIVLIYLFFRQEANLVLLKVTLIISILIVSLGLGFHWYYKQRNIQIRNQLYNILKVLEEFDVDEPSKVKFEKSPIPVFNELNTYLHELINRVREHYSANKQFTANAAHELQTPLTIIKGHIELLLQSPQMGKKETEILGIILQNTNRLARLNSALILLSKIEYQRFSDYAKNNIANILEEVLSNFTDLIKIQNLNLYKGYQQVIEVEMSSTLAEILIANLIQNAIRHNREEGWIKILLKQNTLQITNPGKVLKNDTRILLKRFRRETEVEESLGLGLSIIQRICDINNFQLKYLHNNGIHTLKIHFNTTY